MHMSAHTLEANSHFSGEQSYGYFNRYIPNDFISSVLPLGDQEPLGNIHRETWIPRNMLGTRPQSLSMHVLHSVANFPTFARTQQFSGTSVSRSLYFGKCHE